MPFPNYAGAGSGGSAMATYNSASMNNDVGQAQARSLGANELQKLADFAPPGRGAREILRNDALEPGSALGDGTYPRDYYLGEQPPAKVAVPTPQKERLMARAAVRDAARNEVGAGAAVPRTDPISEEEVDYVMAMKDQAELADFDRWVSKLVNPRAPGELAWLRSVYPEYQQRRLSQAHADYQFAIRSQMIDQWGCQSFDDLVFLYMRDQGKIKGPQLTNLVEAGNAYQPGFLNIFNAKAQPSNRLRMPFASAQWGARPTPAVGPEQWELNDIGTGERGPAGQVLGNAGVRQGLTGQFAQQVLNEGNQTRDAWANNTP